MIENRYPQSAKAYSIVQEAYSRDIQVRISFPDIATDVRNTMRYHHKPIIYLNKSMEFGKLIVIFLPDTSFNYTADDGCHLGTNQLL